MMNRDLAVLLLQDGHRKWSELRGVSWEVGYELMGRKLALVVDSLARRGVTRLYVPTTSPANLQRPIEELRTVFENYCRVPALAATSVRVVLRGNLDLLPDELRPELNELVAQTAGNTGFTLYYMVNWSLLDEVVRICEALRGQDKPVTEDDVCSVADIGEPIDLIIRTGNRQRISGFWPLFGPYAELWFSDKFFPDFTEDDVEAALRHFWAQKRTFGR